MRIVVDLPAPLLPRKPKIFAGTDLERHIVDCDEAAEPAGQVTALRSRSSPESPGEPRLGQTHGCLRAGQIELSLEQRVFSVEDLDLRDDTGPVALLDNTPRVGRSSDAAVRCRHRGDRGFDFERALAHLDAERGNRTRPAARCAASESGCRLRDLGIRSATVPQRPADTDSGVPEVLPAILARKDPRVGPCVVHAAVS